MGGAVTLGDVARAAGVSLATASRTLHGSGDRKVRADLRERVLAAADELNYSPNTNAQAIARGRTSVVGLIVQDIADPYFSSIAAGVMQRAEEDGLIVTLATTHRDPERELDFVRVLRGQRAQAIVIAGSRTADKDVLARLGEELERFRSGGGRVAMVSQAKLPVDTVLVENRAASRELAQALHGLGHRRFAVLAGPSKLVTSSDRVDGFRDALERLGAPVPRERIYRAGFTRDGGYEAMTDALDDGLDAACVFAVNDVMAVGAMAALRDRGIEPPDGFAIAGFDDIETLRDITPSLTTVRLPLEQMGATALDLALDDGAEAPRTVRIGGEVVLRESTPPPPGARRRR